MIGCDECGRAHRSSHPSGCSGAQGPARRSTSCSVGVPTSGRRGARLPLSPSLLIAAYVWRSTSVGMQPPYGVVRYLAAPPAARLPHAPSSVADGTAPRMSHSPPVLPVRCIRRRGCLARQPSHRPAARPCHSRILPTPPGEEHKACQGNAGDGLKLPRGITIP